MAWAIGRRTGVVAALVAALLLLCGGVVVAAVLTRSAGRDRDTGRSVIFVNGDGMSAAHREAARLYLKGLSGELQMNELPVSGLEETTPDDPNAAITDSAAAATAWATGEKTYNGAISVDDDGRPLPYLGAEAKRAGKATGLVTTAQVTDASPAAFFSSTPRRSAQAEIARQYLEVSKPDVILGGGEDWWYPAGTAGAYPDTPAKDPTEASKGTKGNLVTEAKSLGYQYATDAASLAAADGGRLLGLFANEELFERRREGEGDLDAPTVPLKDMTSKALSTLSKDEDGFFLFVEEEGVDEFSHANNGEKMLASMKALDETVGLLRQYVAKNPNTLLIVTGDHDCGGLTVEDTVTTDESGDGISAEDGPFAIPGTGKRFDLDWTTTGHTGVPTPVTAVGPGSAALTGVVRNTALHTVMRDALLGKG